MNWRKIHWKLEHNDNSHFRCLWPKQVHICTTVRTWKGWIFILTCTIRVLSNTHWSIGVNQDLHFSFPNITYLEGRMTAKHNIWPRGTQVPYLSDFHWTMALSPPIYPLSDKPPARCPQTWAWLSEELSLLRLLISNLLPTMSTSHRENVQALWCCWSWMKARHGSLKVPRGLFVKISCRAVWFNYCVAVKVQAWLHFCCFD